MPNRILRASLLHSERWNRCPVEVRDFFVRLVMLVDDYGRHEANLQLLASVAYPYGEPYGAAIACHTIAKYMTVICQAGLGIVYDGQEGKKYVQLLKWKERARTESKCPAPSAEQLTSKCCAVDRQMIASPPSPSPSPSPSGGVVQEEILGKNDDKNVEVAPEPSPASPPSTKKEASESARSNQSAGNVPCGTKPADRVALISQERDQTFKWKRLEALKAWIKKQYDQAGRDALGSYHMPAEIQTKIAQYGAEIRDLQKALNLPTADPPAQERNGYSPEEQAFLRKCRAEGKPEFETDAQMRVALANSKAREAYVAEHPQAKPWKPADLMKAFEAEMREGRPERPDLSPEALEKARIEGEQARLKDAADKKAHREQLLREVAQRREQAVKKHTSQPAQQP